MVNTTGPYLDYKSYTEYLAYKKISIYVPPFLILVGTVSNMLAVVVLTKPKLRKCRTMFYLTVLSLADLAVLNICLMSAWLDHGFDIQLTAKSYASCKILGLAVYFSTDFCNWILVAMTVDRCVSVCLPFKSRQLCTKKSAKWIVFFLAVIMLLINLHLIWGFSLVDTSHGPICLWVNDFTHYIWPWIDACLYSLFPFIIMIVCNACITRNVVSSNKKVSANDQTNGNQSSLRIQPKPYSRRNRRPLERTPVSKVTRMLRVMNASFFILTMPIVIWGQYYHFQPTTDSPRGQAVMMLLRSIVNILQYTNNTIHFFLYCLTSSSFRKELYAIYSKTCISDDEVDQITGINYM